VQDKIILRRQRKRANDNMYRIRVSGEAYEAVENLAERTNMSMTEVATKLLVFAMEHVEVEGEEG